MLVLVLVLAAVDAVAVAGQHLCQLRKLLDRKNSVNGGMPRLVNWGMISTVSCQLSDLEFESAAASHATGDTWLICLLIN